MPYKDPERQRQSQHQQYLRNKDRYMENQRRRRAQPGYRDSEYAKRQPRPRAAAPRTQAPPAMSVKPARRPGRLTPAQEAQQRDLAEAEATQRRLKAEALRRLGLG